MSSVVLIAAFVISLTNKPCDQCNSEVIVLVLVGIGYSIYAAVIWSSIPYVVTPQTVGTAFGICMAIQNIGMAGGPLVVNYIKQHTERDFGYFWANIFYLGINITGLILHIALYFVDLAQNDGVLNKVDKGDELNEMMTSPTMPRKDILKQSMSKDKTRQSLVDYKLDSSARATLKRSMAATKK